MKGTLPLKVAALVAATCFGLPSSSHAATLIARDSPDWKFRRGTAQPSTPADAWRAQGFADSAWEDGGAPFRYGDGNGGTVLGDMRYAYSTVFLRRTFQVGDVALISRLDLLANYDDGFTVWINGNEVVSQNAPGPPAFDSFATTNHESGSFESFEIASPASVLVEGENTIAIQMFNVSLSSSDVMMNVELVSTAPDFEPPAVLAFAPEPGVVSELTQITVTFSEPVLGVDAGDLLIGETPALSVSGSGDQYSFQFAGLARGQTTVSWAQDHGITDTANPPNPFDRDAPGEVRIYDVVDQVPPTVSGVFPPAGLTLRQLADVKITFSEPVAGVDAADLLANGVAASSVGGGGPGPYTFSFPNLGADTVQMTWAADHGIADTASEPNPFVAGATWTYQIDPDAAFGDISINEFAASNRDGLTDEDGEASDWLELYNFGESQIDLAGWSLSDDPDQPGKFPLPPRTLAPGGYLVIFASGKNRANPGGEIHTNFKLSGSGEYLGLFTPDSPRRVADELAPAYPQQRTDHSYGRDASGAWRYFAAPTPAAANGETTVVGLLEAPHLTSPRGFYDRPFDLHLTSPDAAATLRYTTDGSEPTNNNGQIYTTPIRIDRTTILRAAAFAPGYLPSEVESHTYLYNASAAIRSLPVVSLTTDNSNLWGPTGIQETNPRNCAQRGIAWERPVSAEVLEASDPSRDTQVDCGLRVQGGNYVRGRYDPNGGLPFSKYSFRLYFRGDYGPTMWGYPFFKGHAVQTFDRVTLRAGMNDHSNPFIVDEMVRRMQFDAGQVAARGNFVNLFINGEYKGYYNPTERIDDDFMRSWHGGEAEWDVIAQFGEVREGDSAAWNDMRSVVGRDQSVPSNYAASLGALDVDNFIDYLLVNVYGGTGDWPHNNWRAARERAPGARFRFYVWDAEWAFGNQGRSVNVNTITGELGGGSEIAQLFQSLTASPEFRLRFSDRVHKHFYNGGALEDAVIRDHYDTMRGELATVLPGMRTSIRDSWIPQRRAVIMQDLADADLQHSADAPVFSQHGGSVTQGFQLTLGAPNGGTLYYTTDGSDPREPLIDSGGAGGPTEILAEGATKRVLVPGGGGLGTSWTGGSEPFDDSAWTPGGGAVGYDEATTYGSLIDIDVDAAMNDINTSCYIRIPFSVAAPTLQDVNFMQLKARYDDGFIAYLNGVRITSANAPASPSWNSEATGDNPDSSAVNPRSFNVSDFLGELVVGNNLLAAHGLNGDLGSSDFLASFSLEVGENLAGDVSDTAVEYAAPIAIGGTTTVKSRTLRNGVWSAATEATFYSGPPTPQLHITEIMYNPAGGSALEFIELHNAGPLPVDLSFMQLDGVNFTFPGSSVIAPGGYLVLASNDDPSGFASAHPGVVVAGYFGGGLSNGGEQIRLLDPFGNSLAAVTYSDGGGWPAEADGAGRSLVLLSPEGDPNDPANWGASTDAGGSPGAADPAPPTPAVLINEILAVGNDFIELHNPGAGAVDMGGWGLSDDGDNPQRFTFPANTTIDAGGYLVVWCDSDPGAGLHSGFGLEREGESIFLSDASDNRIDAFSFGVQVSGGALARFADGWHLALQTPDAANGGQEPLAPQSAFAINEWQANPYPGGDDWIELYNTDPTHIVALRGLRFIVGEQTYRYGARSFLSPGDHLRLWADGGTGAEHLDLRLPAEGTDIVVADGAGNEFESVSYPAQTEGHSAGRLPDGAANIETFATSASPGAPNYLPNGADIVVNELLGGTDGWVELKNEGAAPLLLNAYKIAVDERDAAEYLPGGLELAPGGRAAVGLALPIAGGRVFLFDPAGREIGRVEYGAQPPGLSIGRPADSGALALLAAPTRATANSAAAALAPAAGLRFNEWLANADLSRDDFVELFNPAANPVALAGLRMTDDLSLGGIDQFAFPPLGYIAAGGFLALTADGSRAPGHLPFGLDADGETIRLHTATGTSIIDEVTWEIESEGVSSGRITDGGATVAQLAFLSPGASNELDPLADRDGDGIPDLWESANGLDPDNPDDALIDADNDSFSALHEYLSGTDPQNPASFLGFDSVVVDASGASMEFTARAGILYTVEINDSLQPTSWVPLAVLAPSASDRIETVVDPGVRTRRFYRIVAERP